LDDQSGHQARQAAGMKPMEKVATEGAAGLAAVGAEVVRPGTISGSEFSRANSGGGGPDVHIQLAVAAERARIASEMGETVSGSLLRVAMAATALLSPQRPADPHALDQRLYEVIRLARHAVTQAQRAIRDVQKDAPDDSPGSLDLSHDLTPREREIMGLIAEGLSNQQIAARLVISPKTVKNHIHSIYQRIGVHERGQAVNHWLDL
jgi:DNA-binding NarL/FixJ family response regulator